MANDTPLSPVQSIPHPIEWRYDPVYPADDWSEEADEIMGERQAHLCDRLFAYICRRVPESGLLRMEDIELVGIDDFVCGALDEYTASLVRHDHLYGNEDDETWIIFQARSDVWMAFSDLAEDGRIEWVVHNGWPWLYVPNAAAVCLENGETDPKYVKRFERIQELRSMPYDEYLQSREWRERRKLHLQFAGDRCQLCNRSKSLHVHHRTYERRGAEKFGDLVVLCSDCHQLFHDNRRVSR